MKIARRKPSRRRSRKSSKWFTEANLRKAVQLLKIFYRNWLQLLMMGGLIVIGFMRISGAIDTESMGTSAMAFVACVGVIAEVLKKIKSVNKNES